MKVYSGMEHINVGTGEDLTIMDVAKLICDVVGFTGTIATDPNKPDGTPRKLLDVSKLTATGWRPRYGLRDGLVDAYRWFAANETTSRLTV
jgi:GDP-L-fucose synthase